MKKSLFIIIFFSCSIGFAYGIDGDGSSSNPFRGTLSSSETWSVGEFSGNTVYIGNATTPDLTITTGGHLTIDPGITVIFTQLTSDLFITGTGQLTAGGSGSAVTFTKDSGKSHWGHISFQSMGTSPASSTFENCILEYGYSTGSSAQPLLAGGALQINFDDVIIEDCIFRYNYATYAGAVMINSTRNTIIKNSYFLSNEAYECGGAVILYSNSTALVENCIFEDNYSKGNSSSAYSGGAIWSYINTSKIVNCTFVENNSDRAGDAIYSYSSSNMRIINSILWGSSDQFAGSSSTSTIVTCAFETTKPANAANSIIMSATASDHFVDASSSDWTLKFISPCRDAGVNTYTGVTIPSNDYDGNPRIGTKDIGTYEIQYSRWLTSPTDNTSWSNSGNWEQGYYPGYTGTTGDVVIPPLIGSSVAPNISGTTTVSSGKYLMLEPGGKASFATLSNSGTLRLGSDADSIASLIVSTYTDSGNEEIELYLTGGYIGPPENYEGRWHYISTPVSSLAVSTFAPGTTLDLAHFVESYPQYTLLEGWVAYDGYVYSTGISNGPTFSTLTPGKGYNYWDDNDNTFTFDGTLNTSDVPMSLSYSGTPSLHGFNLLGNPFSSGLDWDDITNSTYYTYPSNTSKGLYFTRNNTQCTYINGVGTPSDVTGIIPPMQGFFTKTYSTGNTITLPAAARTHDNIHARYKGVKSLIPLVRLSITEDTVSNDETVVRFDELAKSYLDNDFDAIKMFLSETKTTIHTELDGTEYAINGLPYPETVIEIPVVVNMTTTGTHKISVMQLQELDDYNVTLTDNSTGFIADLKTTPVLTFASGAGLLDDRFVLKISNIATAVETPLTTQEEFNLFYGFDLINIQTLSGEWEGKTGSVRILDMAGKTITDISGIEFNRSDVTQVRAPGANGLYLVEIRSGVMRYVGKVVVK